MFVRLVETICLLKISYCHKKNRHVENFVKYRFDCISIELAKTPECNSTLPNT